MLIQYDNDTQINAHTVRNPLVLVYGTHYELELAIYDPDHNPIDIEAKNITNLALTVVRTLGTTEPDLVSAVFLTDIAHDNIVTVDFALTSVETYKYVAGRETAPAVLCLVGKDTDDNIVFQLNLPCVLQSSGNTRRPVDFTTAMMEELQLAVAESRAMVKFIIASREAITGEITRSQVAASQAANDRAQALEYKNQCEAIYNSLNAETTPEEP